mmetsp:Transcript_21321/g.52528  ORF Transcript_21321/g.52528 Transcript_21321/m.52528 type:complete len:80 (-) Transcript_21321:221-460(-)
MFDPITQFFHRTGTEVKLDVSPAMQFSRNAYHYRYTMKKDICLKPACSIDCAYVRSNNSSLIVPVTRRSCDVSPAMQFS